MGNKKWLMLSRPFIRASEPDSHKVILMLNRSNGEVCVDMLYQSITGEFKKRVLKIEKSLKYASHALQFDWGNNLPGSKQLALAVCLELYEVSDAIKFHLDFHKHYIFPIPNKHPFPSHVPVKREVFPVELYVPIIPNV